MIDKVWYDWQNRDPGNKNLFTGGSISWAGGTNVSFLQYPTGAPPWLNVRRNSH
jgi:tyrosinase